MTLNIGEEPQCGCGGCTCGATEIKPLLHKHLLINAKVTSPMRSETEAIGFLTRLVENIDMKIIKGPFASYVDKSGNRGLTAIVMIETSHIAFHIWDEQDPALVQFDLYTCGSLNVDQVLAIFNETFQVVDIQYLSIDRENGFKIEQTYPNASNL